MTKDIKVSEFLKASRSGISKATARNYIKKFGIGERTEDGKFLLSKEDTELLEAIYEASKNGNGENTIRRRLGLAVNKTEIKQELHTNKPEIKQDSDSLKYVLDTVSTSLIAFQDNLTSSISDKLSIMSDVAQNLANTSFKLGAVTQENKHLKEQLQIAEVSLTDLKANNDKLLSNLRHELEKKDFELKTQLSENLKMREEIRLLTEKLNVERQKSFWQKLKS